MIVPKDILQKYNYLLPHLRLVKEVIDNTLINFSFNNHYAYLSRIKTVESTAEKIESGRYKDWDSLDDLVGAIIIIPHLKLESDVLDFLQKSFNPIILKKRGSTFKSPEVFRYDSTRFIGKINKINSDEIIHHINFEVQIRSAFEHAWSVATHDFTYKSSSIDWQGLRLTSQLKSSIEQLDMIVSGSHKIKDNIQMHPWPDTDAKSKICCFFNDLFINETIPKELLPKDMSRFSENIFHLVNDKLNLKESTKWKRELGQIFTIIETELKIFDKQNFPMSLSLFQLCFGMLLKNNILNEILIKEFPFHKGELFYTIFPECRDKALQDFRI